VPLVQSPHHGACNELYTQQYGFEFDHIQRCHQQQWNVLRLRTRLQVRFLLPVPAWRDLHADLPVRGLTIGVSPGPFDDRPGLPSQQTTEMVQ
jgi:hypothetical protein